MSAQDTDGLGSQATIIIATAGAASRAESLLAAIRSLEVQEPCRPRILVVFNGPNVSAELLERVRSRSTVEVEYLEEPGLPNALNHGRRKVTTACFGFLDDDDVYLPYALATRSRVLDENPQIDVVATNGYVQTGSARTKLLPNAIDLQHAPMEELFRQNWLASCGGLFRTSTVDEGYFPFYAKYFEWTMTAFLLSLDRKIHYLDEPTFVVNETADSLSASDAYVEAYPGILYRMLDFPVDRNVRTLIRERLARALHSASVRNRARGNRLKAWKYHVRSLACHGGARYLPYTRKLFI